MTVTFSSVGTSPGLKNRMRATSDGFTVLNTLLCRGDIDIIDYFIGENTFLNINKVLLLQGKCLSWGLQKHFVS